MRAPEEVKDRFSDERPDRPWYEEIQSKLGAGETIYEVFAYQPSHDEEPEIEEKIADIVLQTDLYTSKWADEDLYFRHRHVHLDRKYWTRGLKRLNEDPRFDKKEVFWGNKVSDYWPTDNVEQAKETYMDQMETYDCPFAWLLGMY